MSLRTGQDNKKHSSIFPQIDKRLDMVLSVIQLRDISLHYQIAEFLPV